MSETKHTPVDWDEVGPELLDALRLAWTTIRAWHGTVGWDIYDRNSPEMRRINAAIAKAEGGEG